MTSPDWLRLFLETFLAICSGVAAFYFWMWRNRRATEDKIEKVNEALTVRCNETEKELAQVKDSLLASEQARAKSNGELRDRIAELEAAQKHMPSAMEIGSLVARVEGVQETVHSMSHQITMISDYLMKGN